MAFRPTWQGHLKLSLVTCPVALYAATSTGTGVSFNLINPETGNRIRMITTDPDTGPVERKSLVKGYEVDKGRYVHITDEEIKAVRLESTKTINIEAFVDEREINRLYWESPYYLAPDGKVGQEAFTVIREAMRSSGEIAIGRVVMSTRERVLALEAHGKGIVAHTLRTKDEVRDPAEIFDPITETPADPNMVAIAKQIMAQHHAAFEPSLFVDRYEEALRALIAEKIEGMAPVRGQRGVPENEVHDLMAALQASIAGTARRTTPKARASRTPAPAKPGARRRAG